MASFRVFILVCLLLSAFAYENRYENGVVQRRYNYGSSSTRSGMNNYNRNRRRRIGSRRRRRYDNRYDNTRYDNTRYNNYDNLRTVG